MSKGSKWIYQFYKTHLQQKSLSLILLWKPQFLQNFIFIFSVFLFQMMERWENQGSPQTSVSAPAMPQNIPYPPALHRSSFPDSTEAFDPRKPDPYELYEKSRAIYESRRKWKLSWPCWPFSTYNFAFECVTVDIIFCNYLL